MRKKNNRIYIDIAMTVLMPMLLAYWGYVLLSIHAGTHLVAPLRKLYGRNKKIFAVVSNRIDFTDSTRRVNDIATDETIDN